MRTNPSMVMSLPQCEQTPPTDTGISSVYCADLCSIFLLNKYATCKHCQMSVMWGLWCWPPFLEPLPWAASSHVVGTPRASASCTIHDIHDSRWNRPRSWSHAAQPNELYSADTLHTCGPLIKLIILSSREITGNHRIRRIIDDIKCVLRRSGIIHICFAGLLFVQYALSSCGFPDYPCTPKISLQSSVMLLNWIQTT